jgi:signal transduction histidine kinase
MPRDFEHRRMSALDHAGGNPTAEELAHALEQLEARNREMREEHQGLERAVVERTRELIEEHRKRENEQHFLIDANGILAASLDYHTTLSNIARVCVPYLADCAYVDIVQRSLKVRRAAVVHRNPSRERLVRRLERFNDMEGAFGRAKVLRTGRPEIYSVVSPALESAIAVNDAHLRIIRALGFKSYMCLPLRSRGETMGVIGLMREAGSDSYTPSDLALAENLADRAALALDNAALFKREQEANRLKDDFLATVSHELRSPLTPILGAIYMLRLRCGDRAELDPALDIIERNANRQARIVEDLLDISNIAKGTFELAKRWTKIAPVIEAAVDNARAAADALGIRIHADLDYSDRDVYCDPDRIHQAIANLLANAIKFTAAGGQINVRLSEQEKVVRITVSDLGTGIPSQFLPHVFERFRQADRFNTRGQGGLGVGLTIVRHIVERHGGTVHAESLGEGRGAVFTIDLPY